LAEKRESAVLVASLFVTSIGHGPAVAVAAYFTFRGQIARGAFYGCLASGYGPGERGYWGGFLGRVAVTIGSGAVQ
jgi:hypothetical protein